MSLLTVTPVGADVTLPTAGGSVLWTLALRPQLALWTSEVALQPQLVFGHRDWVPPSWSWTCSAGEEPRPCCTVSSDRERLPRTAGLARLPAPKAVSGRWPYWVLLPEARLAAEPQALREQAPSLTWGPAPSRTPPNGTRLAGRRVCRLLCVFACADVECQSIWEDAKPRVWK